VGATDQLEFRILDEKIAQGAEIASVEVPHVQRQLASLLRVEVDGSFRGFRRTIAQCRPTTMQGTLMAGTETSSTSDISMSE
jgi:hypothetical protein